MQENLIKLPYNIGDKIYIVENYNKCYDKKYKPIVTIYEDDIVIKPITVEGFIIDDRGINLAENANDGWNELITYHDLTLEEYGDCKVFGSLVEAELFVDTIRKN